MLALIQRVARAAVHVEGECVGEIGPGLLALVCAEPDDNPARVQRMAEKLLGYRVFADDHGRMNLSLLDSGGQLLVVSQFTLAADTRSGMRPGLSQAAPVELAEQYYLLLLQECRKRYPDGVENGRFRAHMQVSLVNDGPATFLLHT